MRYKKPFVSGGTFSGQFSLDYFKPTGKSCFLCMIDGLKKDMIEKLSPANITDYEDLSFVPKEENNPVALSNTILCSTCANFMT